MSEWSWDGLFSSQPYAFRFAAKPGDARQFFEPSDEYEERLARRRQLLDVHGERHLMQTSEARAAVAELAVWAGEPGVDLAGLGICWEQDFMVLLPDEKGREVLRAGVVCFPSSWSPAEKVGLPVQAIHAVVPTLNETLGERIETFLRRVVPGRAFERANWGLSASPELNQHPALGLPRLAPPLSLEEVWLRREDQVLFRLPETGALVFGIDVRVIAVAEIAADPEGNAGLQRALATMPPAIAAYKGLAEARETLVALLEATARAG